MLTEALGVTSKCFFEQVLLRDCLHEGWGPQVGEVTFGGSLHLSYKRDQIKMRDYMDWQVTPPTWGPPPPCKQALKCSFEKSKASNYSYFRK